MALRNVSPDWNHIKTFATEANLMKRIDQDKAMHPEYDDRFMVIRTPAGRWTAIVILDKNKGGYIGRYDFVKV